MGDGAARNHDSFVIPLTTFLILEADTPMTKTDVTGRQSTREVDIREVMAIYSIRQRRLVSNEHNHVERGIKLEEGGWDDIINISWRLDFSVELTLHFREKIKLFPINVLFVHNCGRMMTLGKILSYVYMIFTLNPKPCAPCFPASSCSVLSFSDCSKSRNLLNVLELTL